MSYQPTNVTDGSYLAPCPTAVYYPEVAGWCWEEERTGSPSAIHHSGGLLPSYLTATWITAPLVYGPPAHLNERQEAGNDSCALSISAGDLWGG